MECVEPITISAPLTAAMRCHLVQSLLTHLLYQTEQIPLPWDELQRKVQEQVMSMLLPANPSVMNQ